MVCWINVNLELQIGILLTDWDLLLRMDPRIVPRNCEPWSGDENDTQASTQCNVYRRQDFGPRWNYRAPIHTRI